MKLYNAMQRDVAILSSGVRGGNVKFLRSGEDDTAGWNLAGLAPHSGGLVEKKLPGDCRDLASSNCSVVADSDVGLI